MGGLSLLWLFLCYLIIFLCCQICYNYRNGGMKFSFSSDFVLLRKCYCCCYVVSAVYIYSHKGTKLTSEIDSCQCHDGIVYMVYMPNHMAITWPHDAITTHGNNCDCLSLLMWQTVWLFRFHRTRLTGATWSSHDIADETRVCVTNFSDCSGSCETETVLQSEC